MLVLVLETSFKEVFKKCLFFSVKVRIISIFQRESFSSTVQSSCISKQAKLLSLLLLCQKKKQNTNTQLHRERVIFSQEIFIVQYCHSLSEDLTSCVRDNLDIALHSLKKLAKMLIVLLPPEPRNDKFLPTGNLWFAQRRSE